MVEPLACAARLLDQRIDRLTAITGPGISSLSGGQLRIDSGAGIAPDEKAPGCLVVKVELKIRGVPKDEPEENYAFEVSIVMVGRYQWPVPELPADLTNKKLISSMAQTLHALAVNEATALIRRMGLSGVSLPWAFNNELNGDENFPTTKPVKSAAKPARKPTRKKKETAEAP
jgi:hypothetical protein